MNSSFMVTKQANGVYRWTAISSNNARDRDREIVSKRALEMDVHARKTYGDETQLRVYHVPYVIGGAPDFAAVVDGHLVESGEFDDQPHAKAVAAYIASNPDGTDGSGWGTSIGFHGAPDENGVFNMIQIKERSVLPLSRAANPFTAFSSMEDKTMALTKQQREFLETMAADPAARDAAKAIIAATEQSKALDEDGVQRKETTKAGPMSANPRPSGKGPANTASGTSPLANTAPDAETAADAASSDEEGEVTTADETATDEADMSDGNPTSVSKKPGKKSLADFSLEDLVSAVDTHVKAVADATLPESQIVKMITASFTEMAEALASQEARIKSLEMGEEIVTKQQETPRMLLEKMFASKVNAVGADDPVVKAALDAEKAAETEANADRGLWGQLGFGKEE